MAAGDGKFRLSKNEHNVKKWQAIVTVLAHVTAGSLVLSGCTSYEMKSRNMNVLEREGMGLTRTLTSPIDLFGPTYATYDHLYNESETHVVKKVLVTPFVPFLTLPSGAFAMTTDAVAGPIEMLTFSHFWNAAYPWESYEYRVARVWNEVTPILLVSLATAGAGAAAAADAMHGNGNSNATSYNGNYNAVQPYHDSSSYNSVQPSGGGSGVTAVDTTAQSRASLDAKIGYLRTKVERQRQNVAKAEERLNQAISSRSSTITLSRTVNIERTTLQNYESQLSQLETQRAK